MKKSELKSEENKKLFSLAPNGLDIDVVEQFRRDVNGGELLPGDLIKTTGANEYFDYRLVKTIRNENGTFGVGVCFSSADIRSGYTSRHGHSECLIACGRDFRSERIAPEIAQRVIAYYQDRTNFSG